MTRCDKCANTRWLYKFPRWPGDALAGDWKPFARDGWSLAGQLLISTAISAKVLKPCECNPRSLAPWAKEWNATEAPGASDASAY